LLCRPTAVDKRTKTFRFNPTVRSRGEDMASAGAITYWLLGFLLTDGLQQRFESRRIGLVSRSLLGIWRWWHSHWCLRCVFDSRGPLHQARPAKIRGGLGCTGGVIDAGEQVKDVRTRSHPRHHQPWNPLLKPQGSRTTR
jgi:hypothetical protein